LALSTLIFLIAEYTVNMGTHYLQYPKLYQFIGFCGHHQAFIQGRAARKFAYEYVKSFNTVLMDWQVLIPSPRNSHGGTG
jgi:hypothetical protein